MKNDRTSSRIPEGAVPADLSQQVPNNSYSPPPTFYVDKHYFCVDCGRDEVWTAQQQKWYYEVAKGSLYATAVRCLDCRRKRTALSEVAARNPEMHLGTLMKRVLEAINPALTAAGFRLDRKIAITYTHTGVLDFSRTNEILFVSYQRPEGNPRLVAESLSNQAGYHLVTCIDLTPTNNLLGQIKSFASAIESYFNCHQNVDAPVPES